MEYGNVAKDLIAQFKFYANFEVLKLFKNWFSCILNDSEYSDMDYIIPVPLHKERLKARGYNQTAILAKTISRIIKVKYHSKILIKNKNTISQSNLGKEAREKNLKNTFAPYPGNIHLIKNKKILLVDDIITTGTTINECSKVLMHHKASQVNVISIARR